MPQMQVLCEKIEQRSSNVSSLSKIPKENTKNKQQDLNIASQKSTKTKEEKRETNTRYHTGKSIAHEQHKKNRNIQELYSQNVSSKCNYIIYI